MDLLEYQAKKLFDEVGIPVLPSQSIKDLRDLKKLEIPYPVVIKSQVKAPGRGKAGGIRFVENTIDAIAASRSILNLPILGQYPQVLLAEAHYDAQKEFFLAILLDYQLQRPVILGSSQGGINVENLLNNLQQIVIEDEFSPFYARHLAIKMGLEGRLIEAVSTIIEKMYHLFITKDLDLIEINPLGISSNEQVMALDGKIRINDYALGRHPDIISLIDNSQDSFAQPVKLNSIDHQGNIGIITNSLALGMTTWDLLAHKKIKPTCCLVVEAEETEQLKDTITEMITKSAVKIVLINILTGSAMSEKIGIAIADCLQANKGDTKFPLTGDERMERATGDFSRSLPKQENGKTRKTTAKKQQQEEMQFVIRLIGEKNIKESLTAETVHWTDNLETAVNQTVSLAKSKK